MALVEVLPACPALAELMYEAAPQNPLRRLPYLTCTAAMACMATISVKSNGIGVDGARALAVAMPAWTRLHAL